MKNFKRCLKLNSDHKTILSTIDNKMRFFWNTTIFHHYTDHGYNHTERIITQIESLLEGYPGFLNQQERFILLTSAYLHDVGMQSPVHAGLEKKEYNEYTSEEIEKVRELHHISSSYMIIDSVKPSSVYDFGLKDCKDCVGFIADISKYHTKLNLSELEDTWNKGEKIRVPLLVALLRLGDVLDMDFRRVNMDVLKLWDIPVLSKFHWWAHHYVRSIHISKGKIEVIFRFPKKEKCKDVINEFKRKVEDSIKKQFEEVYDVLDNYGIRLYPKINTQNIVYEPEGVLEPIPDDLCSYLKSFLEKQELITAKTGVIYYLDGVPFSDDRKVTEAIKRIFDLLSEEKNEAARVEVDICLTYILSHWQNIITLIIAGNIYQTLGDFNGALQRFIDALRICDREDIIKIYGKDVEQARASIFNNMGIVYRIKGELDKALKHHEDALKIHREIGHKEGEAKDLGNMGIVYQSKGELDKALKHHEDALKIHREIGHKEGEAKNLGNMGIVYQIKGDPEKAEKYFSAENKILKKLDLKKD